MHWRFTFIKIPIRNLMNLSHYIGNNCWIFLFNVYWDYLWDQSFSFQGSSRSCFYFFITLSQNPDEDEETRQYRLKIEEQKRLREEILKRKEMRRQMQAGVRKKELLDRLNSQTPGQNPAQTTPQSAPHQQPLQPQQQQDQLQQPPQQRQFTPRSSQPLSQPLAGSNPSALVPPNGDAQNPAPGPHVKTRLQMSKGTTQQQQAPRPDPNQQWKQPHQNQQQPLQQCRNTAVQNKLGVEMQVNEAPLRNIPLISTVASAPTGPKPGVKRTVMQRTNISLTDGQQLPQKVRVIKLCGAVSMRFILFLMSLISLIEKNKWHFWTEMPPIVFRLHCEIQKISNL